MRTATLAPVALLAALPVVASSTFLSKLSELSENIPFQLTHRRDRALQTSGVSSDYSAVWYFVHEGSCARAQQPSVELTCADGRIDIVEVSPDASCTRVGPSTATCTSDAESSSGHAVEFTCTGDSLDGTLAEATVLKQESQCLGGDQQAAEWGHGVLLSLYCNQQQVLNGTCAPSNTTFPDATCTSGWSCPIGNCTVKNYTIIEMTSSVTNNDCSPYTGTTTLTSTGSGSSSVSAVLSAVVVVAASLSMLVGGW